MLMNLRGAAAFVGLKTNGQMSVLIRVTMQM